MALRAMCIDDGIARSLMAFLPTVLEGLERSAEEEDLAGAVLGLVRNLCQNDLIKKDLCRSVSLLLRVARQHNLQEVQENTLGALAAMALRCAENAGRILQEGGLEVVLTAMRRFGAGPVQRQGCLAVRNVVSKCPAAREVLLDLGAEEVLRVAGQTHGCVDEAYAALRDLGCRAQTLTLEEDGTVRKGRQVFGDGELNFRKVYEESECMQERVQQLID